MHIWLPRLAWLIVAVALVAAALIVLGGPLYRFAGLDLGTVFTLLMVGTYAALAAVGLGVLWLILAGILRGVAGWPAVIAAVIVAAVAVIFPLQMRVQGGAVPAIHDISTDTQDPPAFVAIAPLRAGAPNPVAYAGPETAEKQREAYPDIRPLTLPADRQRVFEAALAVVADMGWELVDANAAEGRIEATHTSAWFGFRDDVVIRFREMGPATRVDIRSKSRVGRSDLGANAARIRAFRDELSRKLQG